MNRQHRPLSDVKAPSCLDQPATLALIERYCSDRGHDVPYLAVTEFGGNISFSAIAPDGCHFSFSLD